MTSRFLTAAVAIVVLVSVVTLAPFWMVTVATAVVAALSAVEFTRLLGRVHVQVCPGILSAWVAGLVLAAALGPAVLSLAMAAGALLSLALLLARRNHQDVLLAWSAMAGGALYLGLTLAHVPLLFALDHGRDWAFMWLFTTFATDSAAYVVGRAIGRHPLAPSISPAKTWEGAIGGWLGAVGAAPGLAALLAVDIPLWEALAIGAVLGVSAQIGDLVESLFKRSAGVKDAGRTIPGHGGLLDRLDSIVFTLPVMYYGIVWLQGG